MEFEDRIPGLITRYNRGTLTAKEKQELDTWINESDANRLFYSEATDEKLLAEKLRQFREKDITLTLNQTLQTSESKVIISKGILLKMKKYMVAAGFVLIAGSVIFFSTRVSTKKDIAEIKTNTNLPLENDVAPGSDKATLTLSDGSTIQLDNSGNKKIADQNGTTINQQGANLVYETNPSTPTNPLTLSYNTLSTPRGGQYQAVLPDGSKVWLNAASSIRYPTVFIGNERNVEITGEVYFEVNKDASKKFLVEANSVTTEVLGTHFNVNSYANENEIKVTLLEGSVKVMKGNSLKLLKPGQQAQISSEVRVVSDVDIELIVAWKNGITKFKSADIKSIMRQVERWYDVDVAYEGTIPERTFSGGVSRNANLSELLRILEVSKIHFRIEGRKLVVMP